jgi:Protein of unknown function (DUF1273).
MTDIYAERYRGMTPEQQTCCVTGHRIIPPGQQQKIMTRTRYILLRLIREKNVRYFGVGGAVGFDLLTSEYLLRLKEHGERQIRLISVLPYPAWRETEDWTDELREREERVLQASDKIVYVRPEYEKNVFLLRDRKLVEGSGYCVSYCNRARTGTAYTVRYALSRGVQVYNASSFNVRDL